MIRIITSLVAVLTVTSIQCQTTMKETPKLVIGITIDQLRGDYLELFQKTFSERGFKRLLNEGLVYQNINFDYPNINAASSIATIYTGTPPFAHGIIGKKVYMSDKNSEVPIFQDDKYLGNYTSDKLSPLALRVSTIGDELKLASQGRSDVYGLAPSSYEALSSVGRLGNGAYWIDDYSGKWATSSYYKDMYWSIEQDNKTNKFSNQVNDLVWKPLLTNDKYNLFAYSVPSTGFSFQFSQSKNPYVLLKESPYVNENITQAAIKMIEKDDMGKRTSPDFLSITYYAGNYPEANNGDYSYAIQDTYARLDKDLSTLIDYVEKTVGLSNTLIFVTSTGYYDSNVEYPSNANLVPEFFYPKRCEALLNMYLMAIYGKEQWVEKYYDKQIYLNHKLIESKNISLTEIQQKAVEFVVQLAGVQNAVSSIQILTGQVNSDMFPYRNYLSKEFSSDIILQIQPGYQISDETTNSATTAKQKQSKIERQVAVLSPVIFFGKNIKPERIKRTIKATQIAPTVSRVLRIRSPNGSEDDPLLEFL